MYFYYSFIKMKWSKKKIVNIFQFFFYSLCKTNLCPNPNKLKPVSIIFLGGKNVVYMLLVFCMYYYYLSSAKYVDIHDTNIFNNKLVIFIKFNLTLIILLTVLVFFWHCFNVKNKIN